MLSLKESNTVNLITFKYLNHKTENQLTDLKEYKENIASIDKYNYQLKALNLKLK